MTGRGRVLAALRGERPDRVPVMLHNFLMAARENGVPMSLFGKSGRAIAESFIRAVETYGYDGIVVDIDTATLAGAVGVPVDLPDELPARCRGPLLRNLAEARGLATADISGHDSVQAALEAVSRLKDHFRGEVAVRGNCDQAPFSLAGLVRSLDAWLLDLVEGEEELVGKVLDFAAGATTQSLRLLVAARTRILLVQFAGTPRFILNAGCAIPAETPAANLRAMIAAARAFG